jgi:heme-degrading monooxygenase HmoA
MALMMSRRRLDQGDFEGWTLRFAAEASARKAAGCRGARRFRGIENPMEVTVLFEWDTIERAKAFVETMRARNPQVISKMEITFLEELSPSES